MVRLIHIVPHLPPRVTGVGDFALILGATVERLSAGTFQSQYVTAGWDAEATLPHSMDLTGRCSPIALRDVVKRENPAVLLVHAVGYGYERRGCPVWLVEAMRGIRREHPEIRVLTWFHELYAFGPPWRSSFWLSPLQRRVTADLARLSDAAFANRHASADWLHRRAPRTPVQVCLTPSNIGEPETVRQWGEREPVAIVFGGAGQRAAVYARLNKGVQRALDQVSIERIWDIGPPLKTPAMYAGRPVESLGTLRSLDVSERLQEARLGLVHYPPTYITKSGIAASYLAHGVPMLNTIINSEPPNTDELPMMMAVSSRPMDIALLAAQGLRWYSAHAHSTLAARRVLQMAGGPPATGPSRLPAA